MKGKFEEVKGKRTFVPTLKDGKLQPTGDVYSFATSNIKFVPPYNKPSGTPEPSTLVLAGIGTIGVLGYGGPAAGISGGIGQWGKQK